MKPIPPWTCNAEAVTFQPASEASALAIEAASGSVAGSASAAHAAQSTVERALSTSRSMSAQRCETPW